MRGDGAELVVALAAALAAAAAWGLWCAWTVTVHLAVAGGAYRLRCVIAPPSRWPCLRLERRGTWRDLWPTGTGPRPRAGGGRSGWRRGLRLLACLSPRRGQGWLSLGLGDAAATGVAGGLVAAGWGAWAAACGLAPEAALFQFRPVWDRRSVRGELRLVLAGNPWCAALAMLRRS